MKKKIIQIRDLPAELHAEARRQAFELGISLNKWLIEAIRRAVKTVPHNTHSQRDD